MKETKDRIDDAVAACYAAIEEGIIMGGGLDFYRVGQMLTVDFIGIDFHDKDVEDGYFAAINVLPIIVKTIVENAGIDKDEVLTKIAMSEKSVGFDANTEQYVNMYDAGIINPAKADRLAIEHAASVTDLFLTTDCIIVPLQIAELNIE